MKTIVMTGFEFQVFGETPGFADAIPLLFEGSGRDYPFPSSVCPALGDSIYDCIHTQFRHQLAIAAGGLFFQRGRWFWRWQAG